MNVNSKEYLNRKMKGRRDTSQRETQGQEMQSSNIVTKPEQKIKN